MRVGEELLDELLEGGTAFGSGDVADEHCGARFVRLEGAGGLAERTRIAVGPDEHDDVHVRTTNTADTARNPHPSSTVPSIAVGSDVVAVPVAIRASARNQELRSSEPMPKSCLVDAAPKQLHGLRSLITIRRTRTTVNTANVANASQLGHVASTNSSSAASASS